MGAAIAYEPLLATNWFVAATFFFRQSLLDTGRARTRTQPQAAPESALDATHELALTETVDLLPAFTRAAHDAEGPLRGALYSRHRQRGPHSQLNTPLTHPEKHRRSSAAHTSVPLSTLAGSLLAVRAARSHASAPQPQAEYSVSVGRHHICSLLPQSCSTKTPTCKCAQGADARVQRHAHADVAKARRCEHVAARRARHAATAAAARGHRPNRTTSSCAPTSVQSTAACVALA